MTRPEERPRAGRGYSDLPRHTKIFFGVVFGIVLGLTVHAISPGAPWVDALVRNVAYPIGQIFLRLIFMIVVPLVFSSLVLGVLELVYEVDTLFCPRCRSLIGALSLPQQWIEEDGLDAGFRASSRRA